MSPPSSHLCILIILSFSCLLCGGSTQTGPIGQALNAFTSLQSYSATMHSLNSDKDEVIQYFFKKPGYIRMDFIQPHKGAGLVYNPETRKVILRPFGILKKFTLTLEPDNPLITSANGHTVDRSDIGSLLKTVKTLETRGTTSILSRNPDPSHQTTEQDSVIIVEVKGEDGATVNGLNRYLLWLDKDNLLPVEVKAYNIEGNLREHVVIDDLKINIRLPDSFFDL